MPSNVLIVNDEDHIRSVQGDSLRASGYDVASAASGEDGLAHLSDHPVDLIDRRSQDAGHQRA
tara:strand:- start:180 stop:368 length:189 start_codon:yes stop_codon:yes gene_type:complete